MRMYMSVFPIDNTLLGKLSLTLFGALANLAPGKCWCGNLTSPKRAPANWDPADWAHMGQFLQGGKNGRLMSFFFYKSRASV